MHWQSPTQHGLMPFCKFWAEHLGCIYRTGWVTQGTGMQLCLREQWFLSDFTFFSTYLKWINYCTSCSTYNLAYTAMHTCKAQQQQWNTNCISSVCSKLALHTGTQRNLLHWLLQRPRQKDYFTCSAMQTTATKSDLEYIHLLKLRK